MASNPPVGAVPDLRSLTARPSATFLWGDSRAVVNRVLFAVAHANDSGAFWLDLRGPREESGGESPLDLGWIPADRQYVVDQPEDARPQDALGNLALFTVIRSDEPPTALSRISDFLRLPSVAQEILSRSSPGEGHQVVAVANSDRVRRYYPTTPEGVRAVLEPFLEASVHPIFGARSPVGEGRWAFEFVFEVRARTLSSWEKGELVCEKAPEGSPFRAGTAVPLSRFPAIAKALSGTSPSK